MDGAFDGRQSNLGGLALGGILVLVGVAFLIDQLIGQIFHVSVAHFLWPFFIMVPGALLLGYALLSSGPQSEPLSILGGMVSMAGTVMLFQNLTGLWATWAYAWALVVPGGAGMGLVLFGLLRSRPEKTHHGFNLIRAAGLILLLGILFFEVILGISGFGLGRFGVPLALIALGLLGLVRTLLPHSEHSEHSHHVA